MSDEANHNIAAILQRQAEILGAKRAIVHGDRSVSYAELARNVRRRAALFRKRGVGVGDGVLIVVPMSIDLYEILIALFHCGATAVFLDAWSDRARIEGARQTTSITWFIGVGRARLLRLFSPGLRSIPNALSHRLPNRWTSEMHDVVMRRDEDPALITFTTGSTGAPKGANRTHGHLLRQQEAIIETFRPSVDDIDLATLPVFPLSNLAVGSTTILPEIDFRNVSKIDPAVLEETIRREGVRTAALSPAIFDRYVSSIPADHISTLRSVLVGGASISPEFAGRAVQKLAGTELLAVYGSTEAEPIALLPFAEVYASRNDRWDEGLPVGRPIAQVEVVILDETDRPGGTPNECGVGMPGEICVRGAHVLSSYAGDRSDWSDKFIEHRGKNWLRTGDAGYIDLEGGLRLLGRYSQRIEVEREGKQTTIWPATVESLFSGMEGVEIGTIVKIQESIILVIQPESPDIDRSSFSTDLLKFAAEESLPCDRLQFLDNIPRDKRHNSKIDQIKLHTLLKNTNPSLQG